MDVITYPGLNRNAHGFWRVKLSGILLIAVCAMCLRPLFMQGHGNQRYLYHMLFSRSYLYLGIRCLVYVIDILSVGTMEYHRVIISYQYKRYKEFDKAVVEWA